jgi:hypothetical protein
MPQWWYELLALVYALLAVRHVIMDSLIQFWLPLPLMRLPFVLSAAFGLGTWLHRERLSVRC